MDFLPMNTFGQCVDRYKGNRGIRTFSCLDRFLCMSFAQITCRESLRDIGCCLRSVGSRLYHMGIRGNVSRSTLSHANENRNWRIYCDFAQILIHEARELYAGEDFGVILCETAYAPDASTIDLCLSLFPRAKFHRTKAAVRLRAMIDLRGNIPSFVSITNGKVHYVNILDELIPEPGAIYVMDRGYPDFSRLYRIHKHNAFFITRSKRNTKFRRLYSRPADRPAGVICDQIIVLTGTVSKKKYPEKLRRAKFPDVEKNRHFDYLTNQMHHSPLTIAESYKKRWETELFFKWIKQHLRVKSF